MRGSRSMGPAARRREGDTAPCCGKRPDARNWSADPRTPAASSRSHHAPRSHDRRAAPARFVQRDRPESARRAQPALHLRRRPGSALPRRHGRSQQPRIGPDPRQPFRAGRRRQQRHRHLVPDELHRQQRGQRAGECHERRVDLQLRGRRPGPDLHLGRARSSASGRRPWDAAACWRGSAAPACPSRPFAASTWTGSDSPSPTRTRTSRAATRSPAATARCSASRCSRTRPSTWISRSTSA